MITKADAIVKIFGENERININEAFKLLDLFERGNTPDNYLEEIKRLSVENRKLNARIDELLKQNHLLNHRLVTY